MPSVAPTPFFHRRPVRAVAWAVVAATLASGVIGGLARGLGNKPDWSSFDRESRHAWEHREVTPNTNMFGYLPTTFFALWPFTAWTPPPVGLIAFVVVNIAACVATLLILRRHWFSMPTSRGLRPVQTDEDRQCPIAHLFIWPLVLYIAHLQHPLQANQFTIWVLALCVMGLTLLMHRRDLAGGLLLGLAGCVKVTPFIFVVYLLLRRRWRALSGMMLAVLLFDVVPAVAFFGIDGAVHEHRAWLRRAEWYSSRRFIEDPNLRVVRHGNNCSYAIVLARWLRSPPPGDQQVVLRGHPPPDVIERTRAALEPTEFLTLDPMPPNAGSWSLERHDLSGFPRFHVADLSAGTVRLIWAATLALGLGAVAVTTARRRLAAGTPAWKAEAALWMLLMFWPSPMMRDYYLALAFPAYILVWRAALARGPHAYRRSTRVAAVAAIAFVYLSVLALAWHVANWYGIHLATTAVLAATLWRIASPDREPHVSPDGSGSPASR